MSASRSRASTLILIGVAAVLAGCGGATEPPVVAGPPAAEPPTGVIAGQVAASLSPVDVERGFKAQIDALDKGRQVSWKGEKTAFGFVEPGADAGAGCRAYTHTVYLDGRAQRGSGRACRRSDGRWAFS
jgi:surface antigen